MCIDEKDKNQEEEKKKRKQNRPKHYFIYLSQDRFFWSNISEDHFKKIVYVYV